MTHIRCAASLSLAARRTASLYFGLDLCGERSVDDLGLFLLVPLERSRGWACAGGAAGVADGPFGLGENRLHLLLDETPGAHIARLLLHPHDLAGQGIAAEDNAHAVGRERIHLFHSNDGDVGELPLLACSGEIVINLAG